MAIVFIIAILVVIIGILKRDEEVWAVAVGMAIISGIATLIIYTDSVERIAELKAFRNANLAAYEMTVDETRDIFTLAVEAFADSTLIPIEGSIEKTGTGTALSCRIAELRDAVTNYNTELARLNRWNSWWLTDWTYQNVPESLKLIVLK